MRYSAFSLLKQGLVGNRGWGEAWRKPEPKPFYDVIIIGGGHGLATAYYLAKHPGNTAFYERSMKLWEGLSQELNFNTMVSQRGILNVFHSDPQRNAYVRRGNAMRLAGVDAELLTRDQVREYLPFADFDNARFPIRGALMQPRGGTVRHDAVVWGYARAADERGVDIIENCEVTGFRIEQGRIKGVETNRGFIGASKVGLAVAGSTSRVGALAGLRLPIEAHVIQAFVTEGIKPLIDHVVTFGAGHFYVSQSDKGGLVFGGDIDGYNSYAQRGNLPVVEDVAEGGLALFPNLARLRVLRSWAGLLDMSMDGSPIFDKTGIGGLYLNCGWCYGGFKAMPASGEAFAHLIAKDEPSELIKPFRLDRYRQGAVLDEKGMGAQSNLH
jgi:sarcosine oxidase subunit beta